MKKEASLHNAVARYIAMQYPRCIFNTDLSGIRLTMGQSMQIKKLRSSNSFPDVVIYQPMGEFHGLFIELKERGRKMVRKDGYLVADQGIRDQNKMLHRLEELGYCARFGHGFDQTQELIDWYMKFYNDLSIDPECPVPTYKEPPPEVPNPKLPLK